MSDAGYMYRAGCARCSRFLFGAYTGTEPSCPNVNIRVKWVVVLYHFWLGDVSVVLWCIRLLLKTVSRAASSQ